MSKRIPVTYHEVFKYLSSKTERYSEGCSDARKRAIRKFSDKVLLEDGVLFYVNEEKQNAKGKRQWIATSIAEKGEKGTLTVSEEAFSCSTATPNAPIT